MAMMSVKAAKGLFMKSLDGQNSLKTKGRLLMID
jgi:hypothetical protein